MNLGELRPAKGAQKNRKRVGRGPGSGHGKTSCRGEKGYKARSGSGVKPGFEGGQMPLYRRLPKRGFTNIFRVPYSVVNVGELEARFEKGEITSQMLIDSGVAGKKKGPIKILGNGELKKAFVISSHAFSKSAIEKIEAAGGAVKVIT